MEAFDFSKIRIGHVGVLVEDVEKAVTTMWEQFGIGPWRLDTLSPDVPTWNRGRRVGSVQKMAFGKIGGMEVELIQPVEGNETYMLEEIKAKGTGMSHAGFVCDSLEQMEEMAQELRDAGYEEVHHAIEVGPAGDGGNYHFDTRSALGFFLELAEPITITQEMIDREVWYPAKPE